MIDAFDKYVQLYDLNNYNLKSKYNHSYRVMNLNKKYAKLLNFNQEDVSIATAIGLLHDIGRFEQYKQFESFDDSKTIDHADYSIKMLFDKNHIEKFKIDKNYYDIIKFAIQNHNKISIQNTNNPQKLMHAKLIRDTDKIDITYIFAHEVKHLDTSDTISKDVLDDIRNHRIVNRKHCQNRNDNLSVYFAFAFDINFDECLPELKNNIDLLYQKITNKKLFEEIYNIIINYIEKRLTKNVR